jgi:hypothetical protein
LEGRQVCSTTSPPDTLQSAYYLEFTHLAHLQVFNTVWNRIISISGKFGAGKEGSNYLVRRLDEILAKHLKSCELIPTFDPLLCDNILMRWDKNHPSQKHPPNSTLLLPRIQ